MTDQEARDLFEFLVANDMGTKTAFCRHYGMSQRAVMQWNHKRPPGWAIQALKDRAAAQEDREIADRLELILQRVSVRANSPMTTP